VSTPVRKLPVSVVDLRDIRYYVEKASRAIHGCASLRREHKVPILTELAKAKRTLDRLLQLQLFTDEQLERE
jgi:hypothetical protein